MTVGHKRILFQDNSVFHSTQNVAEHSRGHDYGDGLLVYRSDGDELVDAEEGYSSAISEEEVKYDPSVWQSVIRYGPDDRADLHPAARGLVLSTNRNVVQLHNFLSRVVDEEVVSLKDPLEL